MKKITKTLSILLGLFAAISFMGCSTGSDDSSTSSNSSSPSESGSGSSGESLTITYTSVKPANANTSMGGWIDLGTEYYTTDGSAYYPKDVPSAKTVIATAEQEGYSESYTLTAEDLPELTHKYLTFAGWYNENEQKVEVGSSIYSDTTLNAVWEDGKKTGSIVYKRTDEVNDSSKNIQGSAYTYSGNYNASYGTPVGILIVSKYSNAGTYSYFIMNFNESNEKLAWATEGSPASTTLYSELVGNGFNVSYGRNAYTRLTSYYKVDGSTIPAINYCNNLTENELAWFLPSQDEIGGIMTTYINTINNILKSLNNKGITATELDTTEDMYWTSSVTANNGSYAQTWNLSSFKNAKHEKTETHRVRAFAEVDTKFSASTD